MRIKSKLSTIALLSLLGCSTPQVKPEVKEIAKTVVTISPTASPRVEPEQVRIWKSQQEYDFFVRRVVNINFQSTVQKMYDHFKVEMPIPSYSFKKGEGKKVFTCEGAVYNTPTANIFFTTGCNKEIFEKYNLTEKGTTETDKIRQKQNLLYLMQHEAGHAFFYRRAKQLRAKEWLQAEVDEKTELGQAIIAEGVADYMACKPLHFKGKDCEVIFDKAFDEVMGKYAMNYVYDVGKLLVTPILDINFHKGIDALLKDSIKPQDLSNLPSYRERIISKMKQ